MSETSDYEWANDARTVQLADTLANVREQVRTLTADNAALVDRLRTMSSALKGMDQMDGSDVGATVCGEVAETDALLAQPRAGYRARVRAELLRELAAQLRDEAWAT